MVNQTHDDFDSQQDFDEFDDLVNDELDILDMDYADDSGSRKKRQMMFYVILLFVIMLGGGATWFLLFSPADTNNSVPMPDHSTIAPLAESTSAPPSVIGLPPGVSTPEETAKADLREATEQSGQTDMALLPPSLEDNNTFDALPPLPEAGPIDGMLAEALPPPVSQTETETAMEAPLESTSESSSELPLAMPQDVAEQEHAETHDVTSSSAPREAEEIISDTASVVTTPVAAPSETIVQEAQQEGQHMQLRLAEMENHIRSLTKELQDMRQAPVAQASDNSASAKQLQELNTKLDQLVQQVDALDQRTTTFATELQKQANTPAAIAPIQQPAPSSATAKTASTVTPKPAASTAAPKKPASSSVGATRVGGWELRSAQPGVAWLGRHGASEMGRYAVGQNVPGLGTVQDVSQEGGRWIVKTTGGTLRQ